MADQEAVNRSGQRSRNRRNEIYMVSCLYITLAVKVWVCRRIEAKQIKVIGRRKR